MLLLLAPHMLSTLSTAVLAAAAIIPAIVLLVFVYRQDKIEKEPPRLLGMLVLQGIVATAIAKVLERVGVLLVSCIADPGSVLYSALLYFGVVAFSEEGAKYVLLKRRTWGIPDFNYRFDGVVYAVFVALGFALWENVGYVLSYGLGTALIRAVTAVPGHACFGVYMGCWYSQAYVYSRQNDASGAKTCRTMAVLIPALLHGAYDFLADLTEYSPWFFVLFVAALFIVTLRVVRRLSDRDRAIDR